MSGKTSRDVGSHRIARTKHRQFQRRFAFSRVFNGKCIIVDRRFSTTC